MSRFMRQSKYRHVYAEKTKKENTYENVKVSNSAWDTNMMAAGGTYLSVNWQVAGGGAFAILPIATPFSSTTSAKGGSVQSKLPDVLPLCRGHSAPVLDTNWSPFDDNVVASGGEDGKVLIWKVKADDFEGWNDDGFVAKDWEPEEKMSAGGRKVGQVLFHPTASNVLASASGDHVIRLWDITSTSAPKISLEAHGDSIQGLAWNSNGTLLATTSRDKKLRVFDPRAGSAPIRVADGHAGVKGSRVAWLGDNDRIVTTGFSKTSDRQVKIWETANLTEVRGLTLDQSSGVMMPFYSEANDLLFLAGKGDGNIRFFEYSREDDNLFPLSEHSSREAQRGMSFLPRRALETSENEIARAFKLSGNTLEPLGFIVPRKADNFQADIFPPALSSEAALTASDWFGGKTAQPKLVSLEDGATSTAPAPTSTPAPINTAAAAPPPREVPTTRATAPASIPSPVEPSPPPPAAKEELPKMEDLEIKDEEDEDSEKEEERKPESAVVAAAAKEAPSPVPETKASNGNDGETAALREENARLKEEARENAAKIRHLELKVETMQANASKIAQSLANLGQ